jgi:hypothetical protein
MLKKGEQFFYENPIMGNKLCGAGDSIMVVILEDCIKCWWEILRVVVCEI